MRVKFKETKVFQTFVSSNMLASVVYARFALLNSAIAAK